MLSRAPEPQPLMSDKRPPTIENLSPLPKKETVLAPTRPPVRRATKHIKPKAVKNKSVPNLAPTEPVPIKKAVQPVPKKKIKIDPTIKAAPIKPRPSPDLAQIEEKTASPEQPLIPGARSESLTGEPATDSVIGPDPWLRTRMYNADDFPEHPSKAAGFGSGSGPADIEAPSGDHSLGGGRSAYLSAHFSFIRGRLIEHLCYPAIARKRGWSGEVMVAFTIYPDGHVEDIEIKKSCGISLLDKSALKTVHNACPFPNPPIAARIVIPIVYQLN